MNENRAYFCSSSMGIKPPNPVRRVTYIDDVGIGWESSNGFTNQLAVAFTTWFRLESPYSHHQTSSLLQLTFESLNHRGLLQQLKSLQNYSFLFTKNLICTQEWTIINRFQTFHIWATQLGYLQSMYDTVQKQIFNLNVHLIPALTHKVTTS